jgi:hypothetical protein
MFTAWLQARAAGDSRLQAALVRRFTPEYRSAFQAWLKTEPFTDPAAPRAPDTCRSTATPSWRRPSSSTPRRPTTSRGTVAREMADRYVRVTVLFALVLFLVAVAQRFRTRGVRIGANAVAVGLLVYGLYAVSTLPRF